MKERGERRGRGRRGEKRRWKRKREGTSRDPSDQAALEGTQSSNGVGGKAF